ncbi:MAG: hypothetical protein JNN20_06485 [Betaproteobacteria bacterium]|nr:hypothetical protein [Betaproteobacteria bacterium]
MDGDTSTQTHDYMLAFDVFNGDADGLIARHQYRLTNPVANGLAMITGVKRDIELLKRINASAEDEINVFDVSWDRNADAALNLLKQGAKLRYFDHHRAGLLQPHPLLESHIDETPDVCTSFIVDRHLGGKWRLWAIAGTFGDNLQTRAHALADQALLSPVQKMQLQELGECLNYNAYGDTIEDLHFPPETLARRMTPFANPFDFLENEDIVEHLAAGRTDDMAHASQVTAEHQNNVFALYTLPNTSWARRVSGAFANHLVHAYPQRAHAVVTPDRLGTATVSIRAARDRLNGASDVAQRLGGGGRAAAAGINHMSITDVPKLAMAMEEVFGSGGDHTAIR